jgi:hypothetical protein
LFLVRTAADPADTQILRESWFSSPVVDDDPGDYEMPDLALAKGD